MVLPFPSVGLVCYTFRTIHHHISVGESHTKMKHTLTHRLRQNSDTRTIPRPTLAITDAGQFRNELQANRIGEENSTTRKRTMTWPKFSFRGMSVKHLREVNPLGRTGGPSLFGQVRGVVIEHRRKVEHDKRKSGKRYLST